jgi:hypothetical protein
MNNKRHRIFLSILFAFFATVLLLLIWRQWSYIYYPKAQGSPKDLWRIVWVMPYIFIGLSTRAFLWKEYPSNPWRSYAGYFLWITAACFLFFAAAHTFLGIDNWLFYPTSSILAIWFGLVPANALRSISAVGDKMR